MKKVPLRKCVVTQERLPKKVLVRVVKNNLGEVTVDPTGKANGRGAYLKLDPEVIKKAKSKKILDRVLEITVDDNIYDLLMEMYEQNT